MGEIEKVGADGIAGAAHSLAKAFHDDPVFTYLLGGTPLAEQSGVTFFTAFLKIQMPHGHVYRSAGGEAAAIWAPPGEWKVPNKEIVRFLPAMFTVFGKRLVPALRTLARLEKHHPHEPHYYLEFIGTDPAHQGKGAGSSLMEPMTARCDAEGVGAYLESSKESNVPFYSRFGFEVRETVTHPDGPSQWLMWRDPK